MPKSFRRENTRSEDYEGRVLLAKCIKGCKGVCKRMHPMLFVCNSPYCISQGAKINNLTMTICPVRNRLSWSHALKQVGDQVHHYSGRLLHKVGRGCGSGNGEDPKHNKIFVESCGLQIWNTLVHHTEQR